MPGKVPALDGIRAIAVILVILLHFGYVNGGWIGVQVFFVLSGFLITRILRADAGMPLSGLLRRFYARRALRILPLYCVYLGLLGGLWYWTGAPEALPEQAPYLATYTFNFTRLSAEWTASPFFTHFWSLAVEEQFYLLWPFVVFFASPRGLRGVCAALVLLGPILRYATALVLAGEPRTAYDVGDSMYWMTWSHADAFAAGAWLSLVPVPSPGRARAWAAAATVVAVLAGTANLLALRAAEAEVRRLSLGYPLASIANLQHAWSYTVLNLLAAAWIGLALSSHDRGGLVARVLSARPLVALGRVSYGVYVIHWPLLALFNEQFRYRAATLRGAAMFIVYAVLLWLVAQVSFRWLETPFLALKDRQRPALPPQPAAGGLIRARP